MSPCESKVRDLQTELGIKQQVLAFQIAVNDLHRMAFTDTADKIFEEVSRRLLGQVLSRVDEIEEITAFGQLEYQIRQVIGFEHLVKLDHVLVLHGPQGFDLSRKELGEHILRGGLLVHDLDGHLLVQLHGMGGLHLRIGTAAQGSADDVATVVEAIFGTAEG